MRFISSAERIDFFDCADAEDSTVEVGTVGSEGAVGMAVGLGSRVSFICALVQVSGTTLCVPASAFRGAASQNARIRDLIVRSPELQLGQIQQARFFFHVAHGPELRDDAGMPSHLASDLSGPIGIGGAWQTPPYVALSDDPFDEKRYGSVRGTSCRSRRWRSSHWTRLDTPAVCQSRVGVVMLFFGKWRRKDIYPIRTLKIAQLFT